MSRTAFATLSLLAWLAAPLSAVDLTKIDRTIAREPPYKSKAPKYCLLVFGPEAKTRVWLVLDGETLYVDRNGNGDLMEEGERFARKEDRRGLEGTLNFEVGDLRDGELLHKNLRVGVRTWNSLSSISDQDVSKLVASDPTAQFLHLNVELQGSPANDAAAGGRVMWSAGGIDHRGAFKVGDAPRRAPIIHFGGPLHVVLREKHSLVIDREGWLVAHVGTPGLGDGTTAYLAYEKVIPETAHPTVEISYPPAQPGDPPVRERYELKDRC